MRRQQLQAPRPPRAVQLASGATAATGLVFLAAGVMSATVSATVGIALLGYALTILGIAWSAWRGRRWAVGAMVFLGLLNGAVAASMARQQPAWWAVDVLALVALLCAGRAHVDDLRRDS